MSSRFQRVSRLLTILLGFAAAASWFLILLFRGFVFVPWFGSFASFAFALTATALVGWLVLALNERARLDETRCRKCGYILRGLSEPRCPECGERI